MTGNFTTAGGLKLPQRMAALIESGVWPRTSMEAMRLNTKPLVSVEQVHRFAPEENKVVLYPPPFVTIAEELRNDQVGFWSKFGALQKISPELTLVIGDFGMGSDAAIALDYRADRDYPSVIRLLWREGGERNTWVGCAKTFDEFADMLGLTSER